MLIILQSIAATLGVPFLWGTLSDLNKAADTFTGVNLFHDGYFTAAVSFDAQQAETDTYDLRLWLVIPAREEDKPTHHSNTLLLLHHYRRRLLGELWKVGELSGIRFQEAPLLRATDKILDSILLTGQFKIQAGKLCS